MRPFLSVLFALLICQNLRAQLMPQQVKDIGIYPNEMAEGKPQQYVALDDEIFFLANDGSEAGAELWRSDGTNLGTNLCGDINPYTTEDIPLLQWPFSNPAILGDAVYWLSQENTDTTHLKLWKVQGQNSPEFVQGWDNQLSSYELISLNGQLFFIVDGQLWTSDGTAAGTTVILEIDDGIVYDLTVANGVLYFIKTSPHPANPVVALEEIWKTDGTPGGTQYHKNFTGGCDYVSRDLFETNGHLGYILNGIGPCLYSTWLRIDSIGYVHESHSPFASAGIWEPLIKDGAAYYLAIKSYPNGTSDYLLKKLDDTGAITIKELDGYADNLKLLPTGKLLLQSNGDLWTSDGTATGTEIIKHFEGNIRPRLFTEYGNKILFVANEEDGVSSFWKTDGTVAGTIKIADFPSTAPNDWDARHIDEILVIDSTTVYFSGNDGVFGTELWKLAPDSPSEAHDWVETIEFQLFPNPSNGDFFVEIDLPQRGEPQAMEIKIEVMDMLGRQVSFISENDFFQKGKHSFKIDARSWHNGLYYIYFTLDEKQLGKCIFKY